MSKARATQQHKPGTVALPTVEMAIAEKTISMARFELLDPKLLARQGGGGLLSDYSWPEADASGAASSDLGGPGPGNIPSALLSPSLLANVSPLTSVLRRPAAPDNATAAPIGPSNVSGPGLYNFLGTVPQPTPPPAPPAIDRQAAAAFAGGQHPFGATDEVVHSATIGLTRPLYGGVAALGPAVKTVLGLNDPSPLDSSTAQPPETISEAYARGLREYDAAKAAYEADHPYASIVAGGLGTTAGSAKLARLFSGGAGAGGAFGRGAGRASGLGRIVPFGPDPSTPGPAPPFPEQPTNDLPSILRRTWPGEAYRRYETDNLDYTQVTPDAGVKPKTFAAPIEEGLQPQSKLNGLYNLPDPWRSRNTYFEIYPSPYTWIIGPRSVSGGTGREAEFRFGSGPGSVGPRKPTPQ